MAHHGASQVQRPLRPPAPRPRLSPAEVMHNRIVEMQKRALVRAAKREGRETELPSSVSEAPAEKKARLSSHLSSASGSGISGGSELSSAASALLSQTRKRE